LSGRDHRLVGRVNRPGVRSQCRIDPILSALEAGTGMVDQPPNGLDVFAHGHAQDPAGVQGQHQHDHDDGNGRAEGCLFETDQQQ
jgi:hypothetical protein